MTAFLQALPAAATSPYAFAAYGLALIAWVVTLWLRYRPRRETNKILERFEDDKARTDALTSLLGQAPPKGLARNEIMDWVRIQSQDPAVADRTLNAAQRTALVSLVYNRGADLVGDRRREMRTIQQLLRNGQLADVPAQFESMTRLWQNVSDGLVKRRRAEAKLWRSGFAALQLD